MRCERRKQEDKRFHHCFGNIVPLIGAIHKFHHSRDACVEAHLLYILCHLKVTVSRPLNFHTALSQYEEKEPEAVKGDFRGRGEEGHADLSM